MDVFGFNEHGHERRVTELGGSGSTRGGGSMLRTGGGCCVQSGGIVGERKSLNTLQKQTLQSSMAYSDAFTMKLLEIQPTRLLLHVTRIGYVDGVPLPRPSPQSQQSLPFPDLLQSEYCSVVTPFLSQNVLHVKEDFYPLIHFVCTLK